MVENFENINSLIQKIQEDKKTRNVTEKRFSVRYIFLSNYDTLRDLIKEITKIGINTFEIAQLLPKDDGWITKQEFIEKIKSLDDSKDYLLLPFSEIARFYDKQDFNNLFSQLTEIENNADKNQRIYIPLMGIKARFENEFYKNFNRKIEYSFVWEVYESIQRTNIFLHGDLSINDNIKTIQKVKGTKEWLTLWKKDLSTPTLVLSKTLFFLSDNAKPDEFFDLRKINTTKELITSIFKVEIPIEFRESENEFWVQLTNKLSIKTYTSFYDIVKDIVNTNEINVNNFIELWLAPNRNDFEKWLLRNYLLSHECIKDSYLYQSLKSLQSFENIDFLMSLWNTIFNISNPTKEVYNDRVNLLKQFYDISKLELPIDFINDYKNHLEKKDNKTKLKLITGILDFEKEMIVEMFSQEKDNSLLDKFPFLQIYLEDFELDNLTNNQEWVYSYFKEYKISKIKNEYTKEINLKINELNKNDESFFEWYYSFNDVVNYLSNENFDYVFWIDAVGIEWIGLIKSLLNAKKYNIEKTYIGKVNLPTITNTNRYDYDNLQYFQDYDEFIHSNIYQYPKSIIGEINKIIDIIEKVVLQQNKRAVIISDHGLSALVRLNDSSKNFKQANHEGRYIKLENTSNFQADENYIKKDNYIIASKHISLSSKPTREVHGGCTPEEVLVPVIVFNSIPNYTQREEIYSIKLITDEINIKNPMVIFEILPIPNKKVFLAYGNKKIELKKNEIGRYANKIDFKKAGRYEIKVKIGDFQQKFNITIKSGFKEEDLF